MITISKGIHFHVRNINSVSSVASLSPLSSSHDFILIITWLIFLLASSIFWVTIMIATSLTYPAIYKRQGKAGNWVGEVRNINSVFSVASLSPLSSSYDFIFNITFLLASSTFWATIIIATSLPYPAIYKRLSKAGNWVDEIQSVVCEDLLHLKRVIAIGIYGKICVIWHFKGKDTMIWAYGD